MSAISDRFDRAGAISYRGATVTLYKRKTGE